MIYATYDDYEQLYFGKLVPQGDFQRLAARASEKLDAMTFRRIREVTDDVKKACCALCEKLYAFSFAAFIVINCHLFVWFRLSNSKE